MEHCTNLQFSADLVTFTEEILDGKFLFLCTVNELAVSQEERKNVSVSEIRHIDIPFLKLIKTFLKLYSSLSLIMSMTNFLNQYRQSCGYVTRHYMVLVVR